MAIHLSKFVHSCLLLEKAGTRVLFDPGKFSFNEDRVRLADFGRLDWIVITHTHPDHLDVDAVGQLVASQNLRVLGNVEVAATLGSKGIKVQVATDGQPVDAGEISLLPIAVPHQPILEEQIPQVTAFLIDDRILHVADSFDERLHQWKGLDALIVPIMAPFLTETEVYEFVRMLSPKSVVPVHDGYARDFFVDTRHATFDQWFRKAGIVFHSLKNLGDTVTL